LTPRGEHGCNGTDLDLRRDGGGAFGRQRLLTVGDWQWDL